MEVHASSGLATVLVLGLESTVSYEIYAQASAAETEERVRRVLVIVQRASSETFAKQKILASESPAKMVEAAKRAFAPAQWVGLARTVEVRIYATEWPAIAELARTGSALVVTGK